MTILESACHWHAIVCTLCFLPTLTCGVIENSSLWERFEIIHFNPIVFIITESSIAFFYKRERDNSCLILK